MKSSKLKKRKLQASSTVTTPSIDLQQSGKSTVVESVPMCDKNGKTSFNLIDRNQYGIEFDVKNIVYSILERTVSDMKATKPLFYFPESSSSSSTRFATDLGDKRHGNEFQITKDIVTDDDSYLVNMENQRQFARPKRDHSVIGSIVFPFSACLGHVKSIENGAKVSTCLLKGDGVRFELSQLNFPSSNPCDSSASSFEDFSSSSCRTRNHRRHKGQYQMPHYPEGKGKIRVISSKGATVRNNFNIDSSNKVSHLQSGCIRSFAEKCWLVADNNDDDECVGVMRYRIRLEADDKPQHSNEKLVYGWISDRSRLKDDPYSILEEFPS